MEAVRFVHISDSHLGENRNFLMKGVCTHAGTDELLKRIRALPFKPDFLVHTGDVFRSRSINASPHSIELFRSLDLPSYFVPGNHDSDAALQQLPWGIRDQDSHQDRARLYTWSCKGHRFLALDARLPDPEIAEGEITVEQLRAVESMLLESEDRWTIFVHFPLLSTDCPWIDREMLARNGLELHRVLARFQPKIQGVFGGHLHRSMQIVRDGILYSTAASCSLQFHSHASDEEPQMDHEAQLGFNVVSLLPDQTVIKSITFNRPEEI